MQMECIQQAQATIRVYYDWGRRLAPLILGLDGRLRGNKCHSLVPQAEWGLSAAAIRGASKQPLSTGKTSDNL